MDTIRRKSRCRPLSAYAPATRCPVLDIAYGGICVQACYAMTSADIVSSAVDLGGCYAMSETDIGCIGSIISHTGTRNAVRKASSEAEREGGQGRERETVEESRGEEGARRVDEERVGAESRGWFWVRWREEIGKPGSLVVMMMGGKVEWLKEVETGLWG
eukprot:3875792-Rhodomonas_salina.2